MAIDGGPAFPLPEYGKRGLSIRDYFAAAALPAALQQKTTGDYGRPCMFDETAVARVAYRLADAMLKAREQA